jgi:hypothetical protein
VDEPSLLVTPIYEGDLYSYLHYKGITDNIFML